MKNTRKQMIRKYFMVCVLISLISAAFGQVSYNTQRQLIYVRTSTTHLAKPPASQLADNIWGLNTTDSVLYKLVDGVVVPVEHYYRYSTGKKKVVTDVTNAVTASYSTTKKMYYYLENNIAGNMPVSADFPTSIYRCVNTHDSLEYDKYSGVIRKYAIRYPYNPYKQSPAELYDIYVSVLGNDTTGDGSISKPYRSAYKASISAQIGDKILIKEGIYGENRKCSFPVHVTINGEGKTKTIIKSNYNGATYLDALFTFYSPVVGADGSNEVSDIGFDGSNYTSDIAIAVIGRSNVIIHDCDFNKFIDSPAAFHGTSYEYYREPSTYCVGNKFYDNTVSNCSTNNSNFQGLWFAGQDQFEVYNCDFQNLKGGTSGDAISSKTNKRWSIHDNTINRLPYQPGYWNFAVEIRWNYGECKYYNNNVTGCSDFCWNYSTSYAYSIDVHDNTFGHSLTTSSTVWNLGIDFEADNYNLIVRDNIFKNLACGILYSISFTSSPVKLYGLLLHNNLFDNIGSPTNLSGYYEACLYIQPTQNDHTVKNLYIYNNTFKQAVYSKGCMTLGGQGTQTDIRVRNNIVTGFSTAPITFTLTNSGTLTVDTLMITHNDFYNNANSNNVLFTSITPTNYTTNNIIKLDPLFVSTTNYNLQNSSPCKGTGINLGYALNIGAY